MSSSSSSGPSRSGLGYRIARGQGIGASVGKFLNAYHVQSVTTCALTIRDGINASMPVGTVRAFDLDAVHRRLDKA